MTDSAVSVTEHLLFNAIKPLTRDEDADVRAVAAARLAHEESDLTDFGEDE